MKNLFFSIAASLLVAITSFAGPTTTTTTTTTPAKVTPVIDSRQAARSFLLRPADQYNFYLNMEIIEKDGSIRYDWSSGVMTLDGLITRYSINDNVIVGEGDEPLKALPYPITGTINYYNFSINGYSFGEFVSHGYTSSQGLRKGDGLSVVMNPVNVKILLSYKLPVGVDPSLVDIFVNGYSNGYYDVGLKGFVAFVDPLTTPDYYIRNNQTGFIYERGVLDPYGDETRTTAGQSMVNIGYIGNVQEVRFSPNHEYENFSNQKFDGNTVVGQKIVPVKVYMTSTLGRKALSLSMGNFIGKVLIEEPTESGEMNKVMEVQSQTSQDGYSYLYLQTPAGYDNLIITVIGKSDDLEEAMFNIFLSLGGLKG